MKLKGHDADPDDISVNTSAEPDFRAVLARRSLLRGLATTAIVGSLGTAFGLRKALAGGVSTLAFKDIPHGPQEDHAVAEGYTARVLIRWGDPVLPGAPAFNPLNQSGEAQAKQFGYNNDFAAFIPLPAGAGGSDHGLLWQNHEYTDAVMMFSGLEAKAKLTQSQVDVEMAAVGGSLVEIIRRNGQWQVVLGPMNRRITANTPIRISGPAAGDARMKTNADPTGTRVLGMMGNCSGGVTPWGTILTCEENFDLYFSGNAAQGPEAQARKRIGLGNPRFQWGAFHDRFNMDKEPNGPNRFGWVIEIDPYDPTSEPVKRTALGRYKHEAATTALTPDGRVVIYSGDDQRGEYVYRFVSDDRFNPNDRAANRELLDKGTLYVARFEEERVVWLPLVHGQGPLTEANGFRSQADVLIDARAAATAVKATPMDRPEDIEPSPVTGKVYVVLTNNNARKAEQVDAANPRPANLYGHIVELVPPMRDGKRDHAADAYEWDMFLLAGNPENPEHRAKYGGSLSPTGWLACPDNVAFDSEGRLWIASDQGEAQQKFGIGDGIWACDTEGPGRAITKFFYRVPTGAEMCGPCFTPDDHTFFVAVQHPAADDEGSSYDKPSTRWPDFVDAMPPRPAVVVITKDDGGVIGS